MSFRDLLDTASAIALSQKLFPDEAAVWERYCREYSVRFHTPLVQVMSLDPLFVLQQVSSDNLSELDVEENIQNVFEMLGQLSDANYDLKKERAIREEMRQIEEREEKRLKEGKAIHSSLEKDKRVISKDQYPQPKELPKSGGINMNLVNKLNNQDNEG